MEMEMETGEFFNEDGDDGEVSMSLKEVTFWIQSTYGLVVEENYDLSKVKSENEHNSGRTMGSDRIFSSFLLGLRIEARVRDNPQYKPKEILQDIREQHGVAVSYMQAWRGKERSMATPGD
ncbi:uncharacterized protein A4U43_C01F7460 [Asparagus officinalis]|uniref:Uncharacterized protein n=1 Tax=Asparagus officinalis TaxID=4686 RepID=A0A5P1FND1_ASPOF|nr:uncharacterized protein A4U43_C01F7460 [Asparagus officinalis]